MNYNQFEHFRLEKKLADQLRNSTMTERRILYQQLYNVLFNTFPEIAHNFGMTLNDRIGWQLKLIRRLFDKNKIFLEIGAGDYELSRRLTGHFKKVIAYEVASAIPTIQNKPDNLEVKIFNGIDMDEAPSSADIVYSNQVFEHLHPDDVPAILSAYHTFLVDKGKLVIITPHELTGPHDVSRDFSDTPEGFHLKEYTYSSIKSVLKAAGFNNIRGYIGYNKWGYIGLHVNFLIVAEKIYRVIPRSIRKKLRSNSLIFNFFGLKIMASRT